MSSFSHPRRLTPRTLAVAIAATLGPFGAAQAFDLDFGNPDVAARWDNTVRYNYAYRVQGQDEHIIKSPNNNDGDLNFDKGTVGNRLDLLSEFDLSYRKQFGFRVSAAGWYDHAYGNLDATNPAMSNHLEGGKQALGLSDFADRYYHGPSGEILDAFIFGNFEVADAAVNVKIGRFNVFWGEALLNPIHAISYGQSALDVGKLLAVPGTEAKELFRPRQQIAGQAQLTSNWSVGGQYFFRWNQVRFPEAGTYMGPNDAVLAGGESQLVSATQRVVRGEDVTPKKTGDWGLATHWTPEVIDTTIGLYYRNMSDIQPQVNVSLAAVPSVPAGPCSALGFTPLPGNVCYVNPKAASVPELMGGTIGRYFASYASDIDLFGLSLTKNLWGISFSTDLSYRQNMPLNSVAVYVVPAVLQSKFAGAITAIPTQGETGGARGNTWHGLFNAAGIVPSNSLFDTASYIVELAWNRWDKVTQNAAAFTGADTYTGMDKPTKDFVGIAAGFTPTWYQVFPGIDLQLPMSYSMGLSGNSAVSFGGNEGTGNFAVGLGVDVQQRYRFDLKYLGYVGNYVTNAAGAVTSSGGAGALLRDRDNIALTFKTTF